MHTIWFDRAFTRLISPRKLHERFHPEQCEIHIFVIDRNVRFRFCD